VLPEDKQLPFGTGGESVVTVVTSFAHSGTRYE
jgi:hypothetical protein